VTIDELSGVIERIRLGTTTQEDAVLVSRIFMAFLKYQKDTLTAIAEMEHMGVFITTDEPSDKH
jgi:hypothetical protein